ncbi:hypothetical protein DC432_05115 [Microbacterium testaceum]|uniref:Phosphotyrosine protein phosphatase I domain-containing protein n=2 Tax=Microbacterium testaceum TaxID=2033 RepID=A0A2T7WRZ3_MICTE|nr:hypothetical protein DC432_05115 [Microbacterium testaceum]
MMRDRLVIVCTANMIRSPFIAGLLASRLASSPQVRLHLESAGTAARPGASATGEVLEVARTYGMDLSTHRARRLTDGILQPGDTVLCAERAHRRVVLDLRPDLVSSVFTVREFARRAEAVCARGEATDWPSMVRAAGRQRLATPGEGGGEDDIVDPIGGSRSVWRDFERQATLAVSSILGAVSTLSVPTSATSEPRPMTRREYRRRSVGASSHPVVRGA